MPYDRYMIQRGAGRHLKLRGFTEAERYAWFIGVLSLAAGANPRGCLRVGDRPFEWQDVAQECSGRGQIVVRMLSKARQAGLIEPSDDGFEYVHDWDQWNSNPRSDATNAERQRRYRERRVTPEVTLRNAGEVEVEEKAPLSPPALRNGRAPRSSRRTAAPSTARSVDTAAQANKRFWLEALPGFPAAAVNHAIRALRARGEPLSVDAVRNYITEESEG